MTAQDRLRQIIADEQQRLQASVPRDRTGALVALVRGRDRIAPTPPDPPVPHLVTGHRLADPGGNLALRLVLDAGAAHAGPGPTPGDLDAWVARFRAACDCLAEAEMVLAHAESGFMRILEHGDAIHGWITTTRTPARWRERIDVDWWATSLARTHDPAPAPVDGMPLTPDDAASRATRRLEAMRWQLGYPPGAVIGGLAVETWCGVLNFLLARALASPAPSTPVPERDLVASTSASLGLDPERAAGAIAAFTLDAGNAGWHAATPGIAAAPLVRVDAERLVPSLRGLASEPLLFLLRELRRRDAPAYHNSAYLREDAFRQDLGDLFTDRRFVTGPARIELRRESGTPRTDIDAAIFDRKTGTLGIFELKSQDPFARSTAELQRQRENLLRANRQVSGILAWLQRHGADDILSRIDAGTAKRFRVQKVYPFVLGRFLAPVGEGPEPDRRAAWGTWPQVLRLVEGQPPGARDANPIASLFTRLQHDAPAIPLPADERREIPLGATLLVVHPSWADASRHIAAP